MFEEEPHGADQPSEEDFAKLRHALGMDTPKKSSWGYRNRYCAAPGPQMEAMERLEHAGLVTRGDKAGHSASVMFYATEQGCKSAGLTKAQTKKAMEP